MKFPERKRNDDHLTTSCSKVQLTPPAWFQQGELLCELWRACQDVRHITTFIQHGFVTRKCWTHTRAFLSHGKYIGRPHFYSHANRCVDAGRIKHASQRRFESPASSSAPAVLASAGSNCYVAPWRMPPVHRLPPCAACDGWQTPHPATSIPQRLMREGGGRQSMQTLAS